MASSKNREIEAKLSKDNTSNTVITVSNTKTSDVVFITFQFENQLPYQLMAVFNQETSQHEAVFNSTKLMNEKVDGAYKIVIHLQDADTGSI